MTEKEIEDIKKDLLPILEKESGWRTEYNTIYYYGEYDGCQVWEPDNTDKYLWSSPTCILFDPKTKKCRWLWEDNALELLRHLAKKYPEYFSKEARKKRRWKKDQLIKQQQEEWERLCKEPGDREPDPETERRIKELLDNMD